MRDLWVEWPAIFACNTLAFEVVLCLELLPSIVAILYGKHRSVIIAHFHAFAQWLNRAHYACATVEVTRGGGITRVVEETERAVDAGTYLGAQRLRYVILVKLQLGDLMRVTRKTLQVSQQQASNKEHE